MRVLALTAAVSAALLVSACGINLSGGGGGSTATTSVPADAGTLPLDGEVRGEITSSSALNYSDGSRYQRFVLTLEKDQAVSIALEGALPGTLAVFEGENLLARSVGGNSALVFRARAAGDHVVAVSGNGATAFGPFALRAKPIAAYDGKPLAGEGEILDWLTGRPQDYTLQVEHAGMYTISLASSVFDAMLRVRGPGVEAENDDHNGTDSQLRLYLEPGTYTMNASALGSEDSNGEFTLGVRYAALPGGMITRDGTTLVSGQLAMARVEGRQGRRFALEVPQDAYVTIDARSDEIDTVLYVDGPSGSFEDDDGGSGTNSRLAQRLQAGRYDVRVESLGETAGMFDIEARIDGVAAPAEAVEAP